MSDSKKTARESLEDSWESLADRVLVLRSERDALLAACRFAFVRALQSKERDYELVDELRSAIAQADYPGMTDAITAKKAEATSE